MMGNEEAESDAEQERELPDSQEEYSEGEEVVDLDENAGQERREILVAERAESRRNLSDRYVYLLQREVSNFMTSTQVDDMFEDAAVIAERSQVWPITMALLDLPASKRFLTRNLLTAGLYRGQHKPSLPEWNELSGHVLDEIRQFPVFAVNGEAQYEVHFKIALAVLDFEALRSAYRIRLYESGVCNWCDIQGIRLNGAPRYSCERGTEKSDDYHKMSSENSSNEYKEKALFQRLVSPARAVVDSLHVIAEGLSLLIYRPSFASAATLSILTAADSNIHIWIIKIQLNPHNTRNFDFVSTGKTVTISALSIRNGKPERRYSDTRASTFIRTPAKKSVGNMKRGAKPITNADPHLAGKPARHPLPNAYAYPSYHALLQEIGSERSIVIYPRVYTRGMTLCQSLILGRARDNATRRRVILL
ncbi:unnamed protein product [Caenorhabditis auriculariae]|uniref:Uncharacterized protein n=1 Tax=Caenorhabditis auriculariae TaxID=2777116 RepID=A0A8S1HVW2_9PELO|nr:unnamed protein product [Caenorhabditis auriculariae]